MSPDDTNLVDLLRPHAAQNPNGVFARFNGEPITFASSIRGARPPGRAWLRSRGLKPGDRVAVMMRN